MLTRNEWALLVSAHLFLWMRSSAIDLSPETPVMESAAARVLVNLRFGLRAAFFLPLGRLAVTWSQLIVLTALDVFVQLVADMARSGLDGRFVSAGLSGALFGLPVILLAAWALSRRADRTEQTLDLVVAFSAIALPVDAIFLLLAWLGEADQLPRTMRAVIENYAFFASIGWFTLAAALATIRLWEITAIQRLTVLVTCLLLLALPLSMVYRDTTLWSNPRAASPTESQVPLTEDAFYRQAQLLEQALGDLRPGQAGAVNLYFVGVAGYSREDVFMKEVHFVNALFKTRFATEGRSIVLVNNSQTVLQSPLASVTSLRRALERIGTVMNRDEDIVFLYLTSHGSPDHKFALDLGAIRFDDLDPPLLRKLLDESGIKRRVIVISACYSGGFIDALKDDNSLVMTAAASDRYSFGCSNEHDFTYFGRAYFDQALRQTNSFITAFEIAKPLIAAREKQEGYDSSNPQIFIGNSMRQALSQWETQQTSRSGTPVESQVADRQRQ